jgi:hypothetical protein
MLTSILYGGPVLLNSSFSSLLILGPIVRSPEPTVESPLAKVVVDRLPWRILPRKHPPGATAPQEVEDGVGDSAKWPLWWAAALFGRLEQRL